MKKNKINLYYGFTLTELMVTISIMTLLMSVALFNFRGFSERLSLSRASEEVMLSIREAQVYGINTQEIVSGTGNFSHAYGVYFNPVFNTNNFIIFADLNGNTVYDGGSGCGGTGTECVREIDLNDDVKVYQVCNVIGSVESCFQNHSSSVTFLRPDTDAKIYLRDKVGNLISGLTQPQEIIKIKIRSKNEIESRVVIEKSGQVYLQ